MKVGLFDHVERNDKPLADTYDERLKFAQAADEAGFYCLHVAEHHCTPLNMVPEPSVYLAAVARLTKRIHMGPLVYLLPLYSPLRLIEEICMLDHLSRGRLEVGVGRGVSPFELNYHKVDHAESRDIFFDAYECLVKGLTQDSFSHQGKYFTYGETPMPLRPLQLPHPPFWYGSSNTVGSTWAGEQGMHFVANGPTAFAKPNIAAFRDALQKRGAVLSPKPEFSGGVAIGALKHIVVAESDAEAASLRISPGEPQLSPRAAWQGRIHHQAQRPSRPDLRGMRRRRHGLCRDARHRDPRDRARRQGARDQLPADLSFLRDPALRRGAALARALRLEGHAAHRGALSGPISAGSLARR
jgi:alkanesulfonate monooxygenase SsuD/methylene tetrahydromethanopterin reductase-like flavin-dependent oxidoreductase (luciferase family)